MSSARFKIRKNVVHAVIAFSLNIGLVFISYKLVILQGGVESLGVWSTLMAWIYLIRLGDVGMGSATTRFVALLDTEIHAKEIREYIDTGLIANSIIFFVLSLLGYGLLSNLIVFIFPNDASAELIIRAISILPIMFIGFFLMNISGLVLGALQGIHLGYLASRFAVIGTIVQLVSVIALVPQAGLKGMAWALVFQHVVLIALGWLYIVRTVGTWKLFPTNISLLVFKEMLGYSLKIQAVNLINGGFEPLSKVIVSRFGGLEVQGLYELAYKTVALPRNAVMAGASATFPALAGLFNKDRSELKSLYRKILKISFLTTSAIMSFVVIGAPGVSFLWLGSIDNQYWLFVVFLAIGFLGNTLGAPAYNLGLASGTMRNNFNSAVISLIIMVFVSFLLGCVIGATGVVVAVALGLAFGGVYIKYRNENAFLKGV